MEQTVDEEAIKIMSDSIATAFALSKNITDASEVEEIKLVFFGFFLLTTGQPLDMAFYGYKVAFDKYCASK